MACIRSERMTTQKNVLYGKKLENRTEYDSFKKTNTKKIWLSKQGIKIHRVCKSNCQVVSLSVKFTLLLFSFTSICIHMYVRHKWIFIFMLNSFVALQCTLVTLGSIFLHAFLLLRIFKSFFLLVFEKRDRILEKMLSNFKEVKV